MADELLYVRERCTARFGPKGCLLPGHRCAFENIVDAQLQYERRRYAAVDRPELQTAIQAEGECVFLSRKLLVDRTNACCTAIVTGTVVEVPQIDS